MSNKKDSGDDGDRHLNIALVIIMIGVVAFSFWFSSRFRETVITQAPPSVATPDQNGH